MKLTPNPVYSKDIAIPCIPTIAGKSSNAKLTDKNVVQTFAPKGVLFVIVYSLYLYYFWKGVIIQCSVFSEFYIFETLTNIYAFC